MSGLGEDVRPPVEGGAAVVLRPAEAADRAAWVRLRYELWPDCPMPRHDLEVQQLLHGSGLVAVAEVGGELIGFAEVSIRSDHVEGTRSVPVPYLEGWYVRPAFRGQTVGRRLIAYVEQWAVAQGFDELASDAEVVNARSIQAHGRLGFREVSRTVHFVKQLRGEVGSG